MKQAGYPVRLIIIMQNSSCVKRICTRLRVVRFFCWSAGIGGVVVGHGGGELRELSRREYQVCDLLVKGLQDREIARRLGIAHGTVRQYLRNACRKFGLVDFANGGVNRVLLAIKVIESGVLKE